MGCRRRIVTLLALAVVVAGHAGIARAAGGNYVFSGGTAYQQQQVVAALNASSFNWSLVTQQITIVIAPIDVSQSVPGTIYLDPSLLNAGQFSWGVVQNEYANQVDFFLLPAQDHEMFNTALGGTAWCYGDQAGLQLAQYGCERFASTLAWSYWQSKQNCIQPSEVAGESGGMAPAAFRSLLVSVLGAGAAPQAVAHATAPPSTVVHGTRKVKPAAKRALVPKR